MQKLGTNIVEVSVRMPWMESPSLKDLGMCAMEKRENGVYSEQDVHNVLLIMRQLVAMMKISQSSVRRKNRSWAIICACLSPELVCRAR